MGGGLKLAEILIPIIEFVKGRPYYHMWYLYMMIGVYMFVPILVFLKNQIGEKVLVKYRGFLLFGQVSAIGQALYISLSIKWSNKLDETNIP